MFSKINHVAIVSENYTRLPKFYEAVFGMNPPKKSRPLRACNVGDGYVGLNINPRRAGRPCGLDHFGIEVQDVETVFDRMRKNYPAVKWVQRPSTRPFAGITTHDPDGNVFDLSQKEMKNRDAVYIENDGNVNPRHIDHVAMRTMRPKEMADFYSKVFELAPTNRNKGPNDPNYYVTDGHITLVIMPWDITDYFGTGIIRAGMDHIGFKVEDLDAFKEDVERIADENQHVAPSPFGKGEGGKALEELCQRSCPIGQHWMADSDGILIDVHAD
ncbi:MAG TPA: VOC family protein [Xanthobacteraceae bacterium]|nr:VOC family protein [Xanthobacteraceae bacterium]